MVGDVPSDCVTSVLSTSPEGSMILCGPLESDPKGTLCAAYVRTESRVTRSVICMNKDNHYVYETESPWDMLGTHSLISTVNDLVKTSRGSLLHSHARASECFTDVMVRELDNLKTYLTEKNLLWGCLTLTGFSSQKKLKRRLLQEHFQEQVKIRKHSYGILRRWNMNLMMATFVKCSQVDIY